MEFLKDETEGEEIKSENEKNLDSIDDNPEHEEMEKKNGSDEETIQINKSKNSKILRQ